MKTVVIDGEKIQSLADFHTFIAKELEFPDYYGRNWDAFWDCLTTDAPGPFKLIVRHQDKLRLHLGERNFNILMGSLKDADEQDPEVFVEIQE